MSGEEERKSEGVLLALERHRILFPHGINGRLDNARPGASRHGRLVPDSLWQEAWDAFRAMAGLRSSTISLIR